MINKDGEKSVSVTFTDTETIVMLRGLRAKKGISNAAILKLALRGEL